MSRRKAKSARPKSAPARPETAATTPPKDERRPEEPSRREIAVWAGALLALLAVLSTWGQFDFSDMMGYYDLFADGLLAGRLSLNVTPDQANLVDMIPYQGRYYFQWGPFPVVFHLAARMVGARLSDRVACLLAGWLCSLVFLQAILILRRRHFPTLPKQVCLWFFLAFALATPNALVAIRGNVYNESIGVAALMILCALLAYLRYLDGSAFHWAAVCGVLAALSALTRVTTFVHAVPFFLALAAFDRMRKAPFGRTAIVLALFSLPVLAAGGLTMALNQARFGSPLSFGLEHKPESLENPSGKPIRLEAIPENLGHYLLSPPKLSADFPWIEHTGLLPVVNVTRTEAMSSILIGSPFVLLAVFAAGLMRSGEDERLRAAAGLTLLGGAFLFLLEMSFAAASRRYVQDFFPLLLVAAFLGFAALWRRGLAWKRWRGAAWAVFVFAALLNLQIPFYQSFHTPTPDLNVMRTFVALAPAVPKALSGPRLAREAAIAANDIGTVYLNQGRYNEAAAVFERALGFNPPPDVRRVVERNLALARRR